MFDMKKLILVDGENTRKKVEDILRTENRRASFVDFDLFGLLRNTLRLGNDNLDTQIRFHSARLKKYNEKSNAIIEKQRTIKTKLEKSGIEFVYSGIVRRFERELQNGNSTFMYKEKGVDVGMAVDLVSAAYDKEYNKVYILSSDSDLQPAIRKSMSHDLKVIYVGFQDSVNIGMTSTCSSSVVIRRDEVFDFYNNCLL